MEKIEVELTPVRIVEKATAVTMQRPQNEVGIIVLKYKVVIPKVEQLEEDGVEYIIPNTVKVKIPDEFVGNQYIVSSGENVITDTVEVSLAIEGDVLKEHLLERDYEQDFIVTLLPKLDNINTIVSTHIIQAQNKYGVAEFSNVPKLYIDRNGKLTFERDQDSDASTVGYLFDNIQIHYKGEQFNPQFYWRHEQLGYRVGFEVEYSDGSVVEMQVGTRLSYHQVRDFSVDYNNLPRSIKLLFKHDDHKSTVELWNSTMQSNLR